MDTPFMMVDRQGQYKSFDFSPWGGIDGFLEMSKNSSQNGSVYKARVPDLLRAVDMTATAVATLPFDICDEQENIIDSSVDWQNKVGGFDNPQRLIYLIASSLCGGEAYVLPELTSRVVFSLQYLAPHTITPQMDRNGLQYFDRITDQGISERIMPENILYFWLPDSDVELGPALSHPLGAAASAAGLSLNMANSLNKISERGFIPPTIMGVDGMTLPGEKERVEKWWNSFLRGAFAQIAKIVNAQKVTITQVGAGMEQLKGTYVELKREASEDVAKAFGIPAAIFMSDKAYAAEYNALIKQWYSNSIFTTIYHTIEETFSDQLLKRWGYKMYFRPESIDAFQEDENERGQAVSVLTNAINTNPKIAYLVMDILGYDLTEEQESELEEIVNETETRQEEDREMQQESMNEPDDKPEPREQVAVRSVNLTPPMMTDLKTWCDMAKRFYSKGKPIPIDFECKALPEEMALPIRDKLRNAKTELDIIKAFEVKDIITELADSGDLKALINAINYATETPAPVYNFTIPEIKVNAQLPGTKQDIIVNVPDQPAPNVTVTNQIPEQPSPNVNVTNEVKASPPVINVAAPNVTNEITVQPAEVILPKPSSATVERGADGKITGIRTKGKQ